MASVNKVILVGRLGKDPELKYTQGGTPVANFSLATDETWTDQSGEKQQRTEWHNIVAWKKLAEICGQYVKKGQQIYIEGKIQTRKWEDKDGNSRYTTEVVASNLVLLGKKEGGGNEETDQKARKTAPKKGAPKKEEGDQEITDDDIPF
jgi:single-strand DNA-binding protein